MLPRTIGDFILGKNHLEQGVSAEITRQIGYRNDYRKVGEAWYEKGTKIILASYDFHGSSEDSAQMILRGSKGFEEDMELMDEEELSEFQLYGIDVDLITVVNGQEQELYTTEAADTFFRASFDWVEANSLIQSFIEMVEELNRDTGFYKRFFARDVGQFW